MKTKRYCLVLAVVIGTLCVSAFGEVELPRSEEPVLIGRVNPALAGIDKLLVFIVPPDAEPNKDGLVFKELEAKVISKLQEAGVKTDFRIAGSILNIPELRVVINMLKLEELGQYVFHIRTSLASKVSLAAEPSWFIKGDVWKTGPVMQAVSVRGMPEKVNDAVLEQVETFISCYQVANPNDVRPADANGISAMPKEAAGLIAKPAVAKYKYVASKKSKVFHRSDCSWAKRISPKNLVGYNRRAEAIRAGKRPCKRCKP